MQAPRAAAVVPAAGRGERVGKAQNKLFLPLAGRPVLAHTLGVLEACSAIASIVVVAQEAERGAVARLAHAAGITKLKAIVSGGPTRQESVRRGLHAVPEGDSLIAVHDGARPLVTAAEVEACVIAAAQSGAALLAVPVTDTLKEVDPENGRVQRTVARKHLWAAQTPQVFRRDWLCEAHERAAAEGYVSTDDCELVERLGYPVVVVPGSPENVKITHPEDFPRAEQILRGRKESRPSPGTIRVGFGYDAHRLVPGRALVLGGVRIPYPRGLDGHSDADVILHALVDALLGAAAAGDIGQLFPSSDPAYKDADSRIFLRRAAECVRERQMEILSVDATLVAQEPKIAPFVARMRAVIAETLTVPMECVSVKATTTDGLGFTGAGEGMAAHAVATVLQHIPK